MRRLPKSWWTGALLLVPSLAGADPPALMNIFPPAVQRGADNKLRIHCPHIDRGAELVLPFAAEVRGEIHRETADFFIKPAADTPPGVYPIRVRTAEGISNLRQIAVTDVPIIPAREPNGRYKDGKLDLDSAQRIQTPCAVCGGRLIRDLDAYRFTARAGERLVIESRNWRVGLTPDLMLRLRDSRGRTLAYAHDTPTLFRDERIDHTFARDGDYFLELSAVEGGGRNIHYLVQITPHNYLQSVFPLGGQRGKPLRLSVVNRDGKTSTLETRVPKEPWIDEWRLPLKEFPGSVPWLLAVGDLPEVTEDADRTGPQQVAWPITINGRIAKPGEEDLYKIAVKPGQHVRVTVSAYHHGSLLDGYLLVYDPKGKKLLAQNDDQIGRGLPDPGLTFEVPAGVEEVIVMLRDIHQEGGHEYGYRLTIERGGPDFLLRLGTFQNPTNDETGWQWVDRWDALNLPPGKEAKLRLSVRRKKENDPHYQGPFLGYVGPVTIKAENVPRGVTVKPLVIPAGETSGDLVVIASEDAPRKPFEMAIIGEGTRPDGSVFRRIAERRLYLSDPACTNMPWNGRVQKVTCATTRKATAAVKP